MHISFDGGYDAYEALLFHIILAYNYLIVKITFLWPPIERFAKGTNLAALDLQELLWGRRVETSQGMSRLIVVFTVTELKQRRSGDELSRRKRWLMDSDESV